MGEPYLKMKKATPRINVVWPILCVPVELLPIAEVAQPKLDRIDQRK